MSPLQIMVLMPLMAKSKFPLAKKPKYPGFNGKSSNFDTHTHSVPNN